MKKVLIAVLAIFLLIGIGGITAGYFFVYKPAKAYIASFTQLQEIPKLEAQVRNKATFSPPTNDELSTERVNRFVSAQKMLHTNLGARLQELDKKYKTLNSANRTGERPSVKEAMTALKDLTGLVVEAKRMQIEALNQQGFSIAEYEWTRARVYEASGVPVDLTFQYVIREAAAGRVPELESAANPNDRQIPEKNRTLVAPFQQQLIDAAPLAFFGL